jgi:hypothetical protein
MTSNEDAAADSSGGATIPTRAQVLAQRAYELIESSGQTGLASVLSDRFGHHFDLDGPHLLDTVKTMRSLGMHISGITVAVAGDLCVLSRRRYARVDAEVELLAISVWDDDDRLERLIEFDPDDLESALAALADVSDEPVEILPG